MVTDITGVGIQSIDDTTREGHGLGIVLFVRFKANQITHPGTIHALRAIIKLGSNQLRGVRGEARRLTIFYRIVLDGFGPLCSLLWVGTPLTGYEEFRIGNRVTKTGIIRMFTLPNAVAFLQESHQIGIQLQI